MSFESIVVDLLYRIPIPADVSDVFVLCIVAEVVKSTRVAVQAIGDDVCPTQRWRVFKGDIEGTSGIFGAPSRRDEECLYGIEF